MTARTTFHYQVWRVCRNTFNSYGAWIYK